VQDFTALQVDDRTIVVDGFSKRYAMTGCRLGWVVVPPGMVRSMNRLAQNLYICPPSPSQWGGLAALAHGKPFVAAMRAQYDLRRRALLDGLRGLGFGVSHEPAGAFYVFADISRFSGDSHAFCLKMLHEAHVAATPGTDFGKFRTNRYVRFAYTSSLERITEALGRLATWTASLPRT
jgi:aspartate/methionine/tyrosine aminotransferase